MKYIRTNMNRIVDIDKTQLMLYGKAIKVADTIEELCDCFVYTLHKEGIGFQLSFELTKALARNCIREKMLGRVKAKEVRVYGAIWTDKGLIYVAKMNKKGELELL